MHAVAIYLFDQVEVLDFAGPFEVFCTACRVARKLPSDARPPFQVFTVGATADAVYARGGLAVFPDFAFDRHPGIDVLVVPGGVVSEELGRSELTDWLRRQSATAQITASVCTGALFLAQAGLLAGRRVTTHWEDIPELRAAAPDAVVDENVAWIDEGGIVTSAGISAGIDMSLHLVEQLTSPELAARTARQMEYDWRRT